MIETQRKEGHRESLQRNGQSHRRTNRPEILCKIWQDQQRTLSDSLVGWNGESHEKLLKYVSNVVDKTRLGVLWHKQRHVILESWMVCHVFVMRKRDQKNVACNKVQRPREKEDAAQFSQQASRLDV